MMAIGIRRSVFLCVSMLVLLLAGAARAGGVSNPVPVLYPLTPDSTIPGGVAFTLTVSGSGFVSGSTVNWNGSALTTAFVSSSKLKATVPAANIAAPSTATITVVSPGPGGGTSNFQYFEVNNEVVQNYFSSKSITGNVNLTSPIVGGDFNRDGKLDIIVASGPNVYVLAGNGDGTFQQAYGSNGPANAVITGIHVADINGDGIPDLIVTGRRGTTGVVATMLGNGDCSFQAPVETDYTGPASTSTVVADFNNDGVLDVALINAVYVKVLLGNANGTFQSGVSSYFSTYAGRDGIAAADFNRDGNLDLLITGYDPYSATGYGFAGALLGNGDGTFSDISIVNGSGTSFVGSITAAIGDFNGDGQVDVATAIQTAGATLQGLIFVSLGNGDGTFAVGSSVPSVALVTSPLLVGDFNADGNLDLATGGFFYYGQGNGTFPLSNGSAAAPTFVLTGDANNDGLLDVIDETVTTTLSGGASTTLEAAGIELQVPPLPDFAGVVAPLTTTLVPGGTVSFNVTLTPMNGWAGDVTLGATNLPNGITPSYNPVTVHGGNGTSTITLAAANTLPIGNYTFELSGNSGSFTNTTVIPVTVDYSVGDFGGNIIPTIQNIAQGGSAVYPITITPIGGFTGSVFLSASNLPSGATATFSQNPVTAGTSWSSNLTIATSGSTPSPSVTMATLTATSGLLVHSHSIYVAVAPAAESISGTIIPTSNTLSASAGGTVNYALNLATANNAANADMQLQVSGVPPGATASFVPTTIDAGTGTSTLQVTAPAGAVAQGTYSLLITMTEDGSIGQETVTLTVAP
jgi:hypothetical protein